MDVISKEKRSWTMAQVRASGNKSTEQKFIKLLKKESLKGWRRNYTIAGKPDIVFPKIKIAIFLDGCFWHGHPKLCRIPQSNREYWIKKIERNKERDKEVTTILKKKSWKVLRIWECDIDKRMTLRKLKRVFCEYASIVDS